MIIQATPYGTKKEEPFAFTYSGDFTDERVDGIGDVTLNTSGTLTVLSGKATVSVYILAAGGGGARMDGNAYDIAASGGGGGYQTIDVTLEPGTYEITIGTGGSKRETTNTSASGGTGGNTTAFGYTSNGGGGGKTTTNAATATAGAGGTPNGGDGKTSNSTSLSSLKASGGTPNGGSIVSGSAQPGGNGLVRITFS